MWKGHFWAIYSTRDLRKRPQTHISAKREDTRDHQITPNPFINGIERLLSISVLEFLDPIKKWSQVDPEQIEYNTQKKDKV